MKSEFKYFIAEPDASELEFLLGSKIYSFYCSLHAAILCFFKPDLQIWDNAGRRGKYFHGYRNAENFCFIDLYLFSSAKDGQLMFEIKIQKKYFKKIIKMQQKFNGKTQNTIERYLIANPNLRTFFLTIIIENDEDLQDVCRIVEIIA